MADLSSISFGGNANALVRMMEELLVKEIDDKTKALADGGAADYPAYMEQVGTIAGLNLALDHLHDSSKKVFQQ